MLIIAKNRLLIRKKVKRVNLLKQSQSKRKLQRSFKLRLKRKQRKKRKELSLWRVARKC